jgi:carbon-monoxide dehydrogenase medium subunit
MFPAPFEYYDPTALDEAVELLGRYGADVKLLAGGQSLIAAMNLGLAQPSVVVDLNRVGGLDNVRAENGTLALGALVRHRTLETSPEIRRDCPLLAKAAALVGNPRVRVRGTLGGSLAHADPAAELPAVVRALDAELRVVGPGGERTIPAGDFFTAALTTALTEDELLVEIRIPKLPPRAGAAFEEIARRPGDFAIIGVAALMTLGPDDACLDARIAFTGCGPIPARTARAEALLRGARPEPDVLNEAARLAADELAVEGDALASAAYRRHLVRVLAGRALHRARELAASSSGTAR